MPASPMSATIHGSFLDSNLISGSIGPEAITISDMTLANPRTAALQVQNAILLYNTVSNAEVSNSGTAAIVVQAQGGEIVGNTVEYGSKPYDLWVADSSILSTPNILNDW